MFEFDCRLKAHIQNHKELICPRCDRRFKRADHFDKHVSSCEAHQNAVLVENDFYLNVEADSFICEICSHSFDDESEYDHRVATCNLV